MKFSLRCRLVLSLLLGGTSAVAATQHPLVAQAPPRHGVLRRFTTNLSQSQKVLQLAQVPSNCFLNVNGLNSIQIHDLDVWQILPSHIDIYLPPHTTNTQLPPDLLSVPFNDTLIPIPSPITNVDPQPSWNLSSLENTTFHNSYHPLYEIDQFILDLAILSPEKVNVVELGHSGEGREIRGLVISSGQLHPPNNITGPHTRQRKGRHARGEIDPAKKLGFVIIGAQHAREVRSSLRFR